MALRIDVFSDVHLKVVSTASAGGEPRYEYRMTSLSEPLPDPLKDHALSARCVTPAWAAALGQTCHGELLVVVTAGRPIHAYCHHNPIQADFGEDINVERSTCPR